ncbi:MAG: hypothetical protein ABSF73_09385, partial [Terriglobia bacterium]
MKNPGCANNRGSPLYASGNLSYQIPQPLERAYGDDIQSQKPPAAMMMTRPPKPACVQISTLLGECL